MDFQARMNALSTGDKVIGAGLLVSLISLFLPWYSVSYSLGSFGSGTGSVNGFQGVGWIYLLVLLASAVYWAIKVFTPEAEAFKQVSALGKAPDGSGGIGHWMLFLGAGIIMLLFAAIDVLTYPSTSGPGYSAGPAWGFFVALIGAIAIAVGGFMARDAGAGFGLGALSTGAPVSPSTPGSSPSPPTPPPPAPVDPNIGTGAPPVANEPAPPPSPADPIQPTVMAEPSPPTPTPADEIPPTVVIEPGPQASAEDPTKPAS